LPPLPLPLPLLLLATGGVGPTDGAAQRFSVHPEDVPAGDGQAAEGDGVAAGGGREKPKKARAEKAAGVDPERRAREPRGTDEDFCGAPPPPPPTPPPLALLREAELRGLSLGDRGAPGLRGLRGLRGPRMPSAPDAAPSATALRARGDRDRLRRMAICIEAGMGGVEAERGARAAASRSSADLARRRASGEVDRRPAANTPAFFGVDESGANQDARVAEAEPLWR